MKAITIYDYDSETDLLSFDLIDLLLIMSTHITSYQWKLDQVECVGQLAGDIHKISDDGRLIDTETLVKLARGIDQTIDGEFYGYIEDSSEPKLCIRAVDSSAFDIEADNENIISLLRDNFSRVDDIYHVPNEELPLTPGKLQSIPLTPNGTTDHRSLLLRALLL